MKNRLFQRLSAFAVAGAMAVSFAAVPVAATEVPEHTHNWVSRVTKVATCQSAGSVAYKCDCGETKTDTLPQKTEHTYNAEGKCSVCGAENPELLTQADPNANNAEGTQTGGEGGSQSGSTENKGDGTENKGDGTGNEGDGTENKGGGTENEGDGTENKGDGTENKGDGTENKGDGAENKGDGTENKGDDAENKGDGAENKGDSTENKGDDAENKGDGTENKGDGTENKGDSTENKGDELTEEEKAAQESAKQVAEVQALIDALPDQIQSDEVAQYQEKVAAIRAILATMTAEQVAQLTGLEKLKLELTTADEVANPVVENPVAKIGEQGFATFQDAFNAFNTMTDNVAVHILEPVEFIDGMELKGNYDSITFVGKEGADAKITINQTAGGDYLESNKKVFFKNLTLDKYKADWAQNSGHMGNYFSIQGGTVSYEGCTFPNGACTSSGTAIYNSCQFSHTQNEYGLWVYDDAHVTVQGGTFNSAKGIKLYAEDETTVTSTLKVEYATFTENVTKKPAVAIAYAASVKLLGNTYQNPEGVLELNSGSDANCNGIEFVIKDRTGADISAKIAPKDNNDAPCGVVMDGKLYLNVAKAAEAAKPNSKVTVLYAPTGEEKAEFPAGTELTFPADVSKPDNIVVKPSSAQVGGVHYATVQEAVDAAAKSGGEVVIGSNVALDKPLIIPAGKPVTMQVNGHKITGTGSISGKLTLKNLNANGTDVILPQGGKVTFQNGSVLVTADAVTNAAGNSVGYSKPIQITYGGHDYTYFLGLGGSNDGKLSIDANGKPIVSGQHYVVKAKVEKIEKFTMTGIYNGSVTSNDFYKNTNATLQFVTDAPATALEVGFVTVDGKQITDSSCFSVTSGDTAAVTLSNKYLRSLSIGVHTLQMHFKDGKTVYGIFSVRTTSNADSSNPKTGDTIFLPIAVMTLSLTALAVLMPRKKKFF